MTAAELIAELQQIPPDTQIRVWADHGQSCMQASSSGMMTIAKVDLDEWMCDTVAPEDADEYRKEDLAYVFEIGAP